MEYKNEKTQLFFGVKAASLSELTESVLVGFGCQLETVSLPKSTRGEKSEPSRFGSGCGGLVKKDTTSKEVSDLSLEGMADSGDEGYDAAASFIKTAYDNDVVISFYFIHPDGVSKKWGNIKIKDFNDDPDGAADEKIKFKLVALMKTDFLSA